LPLDRLGAVSEVEPWVPCFGWQAALSERAGTRTAPTGVYGRRPGLNCDGAPASPAGLSLAQLRGCPFRGVLFSMVFGCFLGVMGRMESMSSSDLRMVCGLLMVAGFMMLRRLKMVFRGVGVMFSRLFMVFSTRMSCHVLILLFEIRVPFYGIRGQLCFKRILILG